MAMTQQQIDLVIAAQSGDVKSFEQLYSMYYDKVYGFARMLLKNEANAEDILQETFITAWRKLDTLESPPTFFVWIQIIAKNLCHMQLRRKDAAILLDAEQDLENIDTAESEAFLPSVYAEKADLQERLGRIIDGLSDVHRQTIVLYYFNELSVDEISEVMACSPGTVKSRLFVARNAIKVEVEEQERKNGEKFYGLALPIVPLGQLIKSHMETLSISQSAANASLSVVADSISNLTGTAATAKTQSRKTEDTKMAQKLSVKAKIIAGVSAVAALGAVAVLVVILANGGKEKNGPVATNPPSPLTSPLGTQGPAPSAESTQPPGPAAEPSASAAPSSTPTTSSPADTTNPTHEMQTSYAYMTDWGERMDVYQNYAFDYMDWFTGAEAVDKYMQDHPGVSRAEAEDMVEEAGYIRSVNPPQNKWLNPTDDTEYYMPDENLANKKVSYDTFRDRMIPAIENGETWLTFVKITFIGEDIIKIEWAYRP